MEYVPTLMQRVLCSVYLGAATKFLSLMSWHSDSMDYFPARREAYFCSHPRLTAAPSFTAAVRHSDSVFVESKSTRCPVAVNVDKIGKQGKWDVTYLLGAKSHSHTDWAWFESRILWYLNIQHDAPAFRRIYQAEWVPPPDRGVIRE